MLLYSARSQSPVASLPRISNTLETLSIVLPGFRLSTLCLRDITLEDSEGFRSLFRNLLALSLKDVLFLTQHEAAPVMPSTLLRSLAKLVKFRVEETKGVPKPACGKCGNIPTTVKHLAILGYANRYFTPPIAHAQFQSVHYTHAPQHGKILLNTRYLSVTSLSLLNSVLISDINTPERSLRGIWVKRSPKIDSRELRREKTVRVHTGKTTWDFHGSRKMCFYYGMILGSRGELRRC